MSKGEKRIIQRRLDLIRWTFEIEDVGTYINVRWQGGPSIEQVRGLLGQKTEAGRPFVLGRSNNGEGVNHVQQP